MTMNSGEARTPVSDRDRDAIRHYDDLTVSFYMSFWNATHLHFGLFDAGEYPEPGDVFEGPVSEKGLERMIEAIIAPAGITQDSIVVDAGCGVGGTSIYLAQTRGCRVTGVNINHQQMKIAAGKATDEGMDHLVDFRYANCSEGLPFGNDSIDVVVNVDSACHYGDRGQFLREVFRILKPAGRVVAMDWLVTEGTTSRQRDAFIRPLCELWASPGLETRSSYTGLLRDAGLAVRECTGFDGRDIGSLRLVECYVRTLKGLVFLGLLPARLRPVLPMVVALETAWRKGFFELGRYWAEKPDSA